MPRSAGGGGGEMSHCRVADPNPARLGLTLLLDLVDLHLSCRSTASSPPSTGTVDLLCVGASPAEILAKELEDPLPVSWLVSAARSVCSHPALRAAMLGFNRSRLMAPPCTGCASWVCAANVSCRAGRANLEPPVYTWHKPESSSSSCSGSAGRGL